eukprot:Rhum_TRINITY_DN14469_c3_g1::Rhum_TRINITY_DN14469_c3_g1_i1::g.90334::m.90334
MSIASEAACGGFDLTAALGPPPPLLPEACDMDLAAARKRKLSAQATPFIPSSFAKPAAAAAPQPPQPDWTLARNRVVQHAAHQYRRDCGLVDRMQAEVAQMHAKRTAEGRAMMNDICSLSASVAALTQSITSMRNVEADFVRQQRQHQQQQQQNEAALSAAATPSKDLNLTCHTALSASASSGCQTPNTSQQDVASDILFSMAHSAAATPEGRDQETDEDFALYNLLQEQPAL